MMKTRAISLFLFTNVLLAGALSAADDARRSFPAHTIAGSELRVLPTTEHGRDYQLHIGLPPGYAEETEKTYPVVFVTDAYWDFVKMTTAHGSLVYDKVTPEFIVVGLGYAGEDLDYGVMRRWELSPVPREEGSESSGRAADFLNTIETVIIPFVESEYRVDPSHRVLAGASLGGLFTLYAMLTKPELFEAYIAATPAVIVGDDWLLKYEEKFAESGKQLPARVYVTGGGNESPGFLGGILRFNAQFASRDYEGLEYKFRIIDGERHAGMQIETYTRGLRYVFKPHAPETGPAASP